MARSIQQKDEYIWQLMFEKVAGIISDKDFTYLKTKLRSDEAMAEALVALEMCVVDIRSDKLPPFEWKDFLPKFDPGSQINQKSAIVYSLDVIDIEMYRTLLRHPALLGTLSWRHFEKLLADILATFGYDVELMQGTKDGGIDIVAFNRNSELGQHKYLLQAKRWNNKVDIDVVKNVLFCHTYYKVTKSCLATTATFTKGARSLAQEYKWQLELKDYTAIQQWIAKAYQLKTEREIRIL